MSIGRKVNQIKRKSGRGISSAHGSTAVRLAGTFDLSIHAFRGPFAQCAQCLAQAMDGSNGFRARKTLVAICYPVNQYLEHLLNRRAIANDLAAVLLHEVQVDAGRELVGATRIDDLHAVPPTTECRAVAGFFLADRCPDKPSQESLQIPDELFQRLDLAQALPHGNE